mgnify:CR=1 FL=1
MATQGVVKWFNNTKKYGFINTPDGKEIFVHFSEIQIEGYKTLKRGDVVEFEVAGGPKGERAVQVQKIASKPKKDPEDKKNRFLFHRGAWIDPTHN